MAKLMQNYPILVIIICKIGWVANVTGFSIVLWSRLHLIINNPRLLKYILIFILVNGFICHTPIVVFEFGLRSKHHDLYYHPMQIMERFQQTSFTLQETFLSCLHIYHSKQFLNIGYPMHTRKIIGLLLCVQLLVVALDAMLTTFDYSDMFTLKCIAHPFVYSIKLKLESIVLNQFQSLVRRGFNAGLGGPGSTLPVSDSIGTGPSASSRNTSKTISVFDRGLIKKADAAAKESQEQVFVLGEEWSNISSEPGKDERGGVHRQMEADKHDLENVVGTPDDGVGDIERQYLGRWEAKD